MTSTIAGTAQSLTGQASCDACSAGFYADVAGMRHTQGTYH